MDWEQTADLLRLSIPLALRSWKCHLIQCYRISWTIILFCMCVNSVCLIPWISLVAERGRNLTKQQGINTWSQITLLSSFVHLKRTRGLQALDSTKSFLLKENIPAITHWNAAIPVYKTKLTKLHRSSISVEVICFFSIFPNSIKLVFPPLFLQLQLFRAGKEYKK